MKKLDLEKLQNIVAVSSYDFFIYLYPFLCFAEKTSEKVKIVVAGRTISIPDIFSNVFNFEPTNKSLVHKCYFSHSNFFSLK